MKKTSNCGCLLLVVSVIGFLSPLAVHAADYHVNSAQALQNALTLAAASTTSNNIYVTNGYYLGNFNYNSANVNELTLLAETNLSNTQITIDSGGTGSPMSITATASPNITVQGMTFLRNCGSTSLGGLQIAGGNTAILVSGCQFLSQSNSTGIGLYITSGTNATVTNCTATGIPGFNGGAGISISGVKGNVAVWNCSITTNAPGLFVSGAGVVTVSNSFMSGNSQVNGGGAGAYCSGAIVTLTGNTFTGNSEWANAGGGSYCSGSTIILTGNNFTGNILRNFFSGDVQGGGGAYCSGTTVTLSGNTFTSNSVPGISYNGAYGGGGTFCEGTVALYNNTFTGNSVPGTGSGGGGGAFCEGTVTLSNNIFTGNSSVPCDGGGVYCEGTMTLFRNTFQQNLALSGGGFYASGPTINLLDNLVVMNAVNTTTSQGGGIWVDASATLNMINNTVTGNTSPGSGGGVAFIVTGTVELLNVYNNIIWGNSATVSGGDVYLSGTGQKKVFYFNDADNYYGVWDIAQNNIDLSPQFFNPISGDYHTQSTSPCVNTGSIGAPSLPLTDLDGNSRTNSAGLVDLGCYEFNTTATHPADTNAAFVITAAEFNAYAAAWKNGQTWTNGPNPGPNPVPANYMTRAGYLMTNGPTYTNDGSARPVNWKIKH